MALSLVGSQLAICLPFIVCAMYIGYLDDEIALASFGLCMTLINLFFNGFSLGFFEVLGSFASRGFGSGNFALMSKSLFQVLAPKPQTLILILFLIAFWFLISLYAFEILTFIGIDPEIAGRAQAMASLSNVFMSLQAINQILQTYLSSQKVTSPFIFSNIVSILISLYFGRRYIVDQDYRELGFCYTRIVQELFGVAYSACVLLFMADKRSRVLPSLQMVLSGFGDYLVFNLKTAITFYGECLSFEINMFFVAFIGELVQLAAYVSVLNFAIPIFFISIGLANTFRTILGITLGNGKIFQARANSLIFTLYVLIFSIIFVILIEFHCEQIAVIFTGHTRATPIVASGIRFYYLNVFPTFILYSQTSVLRFINLNDLAVKVTMIVMPAMVCLVSWLFAIHLQMGIYGLILGFFASKGTAVLLFFYFIYTSNWSLQYREFKKIENNDKTEKLIDEIELN